MDDRDSRIQCYFKEGYTHKEIFGCTLCQGWYHIKVNNFGSSEKVVSISTLPRCVFFLRICLD